MDTDEESQPDEPKRGEGIPRPSASCLRSLQDSDLLRTCCIVKVPVLMAVILGLTFTAIYLSFLPPPSHRRRLPESVCPDGWRQRVGSSRCFFIPTAEEKKEVEEEEEEEGLDWQDAQRYCHNVRGQLAVVRSPEDQEFLHNLILEFSTNSSGSKALWIGLQDLVEDGNFKWVDGTRDEVNRSFWDDGQPNNDDSVRREDSLLEEDCVMMILKEGGGLKCWHDERCWARRRFICEMDLDDQWCLF